MTRQLYSDRAGRPRSLKQQDFVGLLWSGIQGARAKGLFAEAFQGHHTDDGEHVAARIHDEDGYFLRALKASAVRVTADGVSGGAPAGLLLQEDVLFDLIELLYEEHVSEPTRREHTAYDTTIFYGPFDQAAGRRILREKLNPLLQFHDPPLELLESGLIVERPPDDFHELVAEPIEADMEPEVREPVEAAIDQFLRRGATLQDRRSAVKQLADALERLRSEIKQELLSKDESALFQIANGFAIRHNDRGQQGDYDKDVWLEWIFYIYLATARAMLRVRQRQAEGGSEPSSGDAGQIPS